MVDSNQIKYSCTGIYRDINEPVLCGDNVVFVQNTMKGSKISIYNITTENIKSIDMKNILCFNVHTDNKVIAFEYSGIKRGLGIIHIDTLEIEEHDNIGYDIILGDISNDYAVLRKGYNIILYDIKRRLEKNLALCGHITGTPTVGRGTCAWLQLYKNRSCMTYYDIYKNRSLIFALPGYINKLYLFEDYIIYQSCVNNECFIYLYDTLNGQTKEIYQSLGWIELYKGKDGIIVWTERRQYQDSYIYDIWTFDICNNKLSKVVSNCNHPVIPTVSRELLLWINPGVDGDNICLMPIRL